MLDLLVRPNHLISKLNSRLLVRQLLLRSIRRKNRYFSFTKANKSKQKKKKTKKRRKSCIQNDYQFFFPKSSCEITITFALIIFQFCDQHHSHCQLLSKWRRFVFRIVIALNSSSFILLSLNQIGFHDGNIINVYTSTRQLLLCRSVFFRHFLSHS